VFFQIRTPLHTVNGYAELLSRTELTVEQLQYVTNIQQACHAINVIAGNVLG
jgi:signal transduction histidine kinase